MSATLPQPIPKDLREQMVKRMQSAPEQDILFVYEVMLFAEKSRLWDEIQREAADEASRGLHADVPELIRQFRARRKKSA